eukprot:Skav223560  [mRNA]  locus=scaffold2197:51047:52243:- [translate_table: standard]
MERSFQLDTIPSAHLHNFLWDAWDVILTQRIHERKGLQLWPEIDSLETRRVPLPENNREHAVIANLRCIGSIWADQKEKWTDIHNSDELTCPLCSEKDTREHFPFECQGIAELAEQYAEETKLAKTQFPHLCFLPVIHKHPQLKILQQAHFARTLPAPFVPLQMFDDDGFENFYTDGSCIFPEQGGRLSSFAIIQDCCTNDLQRIEQVLRYKETGLMPTSFRTVQVGMTTGPQTINRAEFSALLQIVSSCGHARVHSDSAWAIDAFAMVQNCESHATLTGSPNDDLLQQLFWALHAKDGGDFHIRKIAAHQDDTQAQTELELYHILGNREADRVAKVGVQAEISPIHGLCWEIGGWYKQQRVALEKLTPFLAKAEMMRLDAFDARNADPETGGGEALF